MEMLHSIW